MLIIVALLLIVSCGQIYSQGGYVVYTHSKRVPGVEEQRKETKEITKKIYGYIINGEDVKKVIVTLTVSDITGIWVKSYKGITQNSYDTIVASIPIRINDDIFTHKVSLGGGTLYFDASFLE